MIFNKEKYFSHNTIGSFFHQVKVVLIRFTKNTIIENESTLLIPQTARNTKELDINKLNSICIPKAFEIKKGQLKVNIYKCNSCGDCLEYKEASISLVEVDILTTKFLNLQR